MNRLCVIAVFSVLGAALPASERAVVTMLCPLDNAEFQALQEFSGFAAGQRLDLKKLGAISQPQPLARCPACSLPVFDRHPNEEMKARLRRALRSERYQSEGRTASPWFALGVLREELAARPYEIAWTYLQASWEAEEAGEPALYGEAARRAIRWFDHAVAVRPDNAEARREHHLARYLPVELARRTGDFADARRRLQALPAEVAAQGPWWRNALAAQRELIAAGVSAPDDQASSRPAPVSRP